jgi:prepilin signal peptidase PulO-like enzyme (type II secretory pathway)
MDPSPSPTVEPYLFGTDFSTLIAETALVAVLGIMLALVVLVLFAVLLLRASRAPWPTPIIAPLAMLSLVFGVAGMYAAALIPLAGAGVGALAGVLTARLGKGDGDGTGDP